MDLLMLYDWLTNRFKNRSSGFETEILSCYVWIQPLGRYFGYDHATTVGVTPLNATFKCLVEKLTIALIHLE